MDIGDILMYLGIIIFIVFIIIVLPILFMFNIGSPNNGTHTGYVTAVEKSGLIFRVNSVYFKTDTQSSQEDKYCATNEIVEQLRQAQVEKKLVTIEYKRGFTMPMWDCGTDTETEIIGIK